MWGKITEFIRDWIASLGLIVGGVVIVFGLATTILIGIARLIAAVFHLTLPVPFWPFPVALVVGILLFIFSLSISKWETVIDGYVVPPY